MELVEWDKRVHGHLALVLSLICGMTARAGNLDNGHSPTLDETDFQLLVKGLLPGCRPTSLAWNSIAPFQPQCK